MAEAILYKRCKLCLRDLSIENFGVAKQNKDGRRGWCKTCVKTYQAAWYAARADTLRARMRADHAAKRDERNAKKRAWGAANKQLKSARAKIYRDANKAKISARDAQYRARVAVALKEKKALYYQDNKRRIRAQQARLRAEDPERWQRYRAENAALLRERRRQYDLKNREKKIAARKAWRIANPDADRVHKQNRRDRLRRHGDKLSPGIVDRLMKLQRGRCACCGTKLGPNYEVDHIVPLSRGGRNVDANVQLLRKICNLRKHARDPIEFMQSLGYLL